MAITGTWTYSGNPADTLRDAVRFLVHDTDSTDQKLSDEEIEWMLSVSGNNVYRAALLAATQVATSFAAQATTKTVGALSISYSARASEYRSLITDLRARLNLGFGAFVLPYAGGISISDKRENESDTDWDRPAFGRKMHDNPGTYDHRPELMSPSS